MTGGVDIHGIRVFPFATRAELLGFVADRKAILVAVNAEKIMKKDPRLREIINRNVGYPDGIGAVAALRQKKHKSTKIPGAELWLDIIREFREKSFYLLGASQEVIENTVGKLADEHPRMRIAGYRNGYLRDNDKEELIRELKDKKPDVVFVAQGSPRQEFLMDELIAEHPALYVGLGGSFDVYTGLKERAPRLFLKLHLEWLYRLLREPTRAARQLALVRFAGLYLAGRL